MARMNRCDRYTTAITTDLLSIAMCPATVGLLNRQQPEDTGSSLFWRDFLYTWNLDWPHAVMACMIPHWLPDNHKHHTPTICCCAYYTDTAVHAAMASLSRSTLRAESLWLICYVEIRVATSQHLHTSSRHTAHTLRLGKTCHFRLRYM